MVLSTAFLYPNEVIMELIFERISLLETIIFTSQ